MGNGLIVFCCVLWFVICLVVFMMVGWGRVCVKFFGSLDIGGGYVLAIG
jgi:hypothetical protein